MDPISAGRDGTQPLDRSTRTGEGHGPSLTRPGDDELREKWAQMNIAKATRPALVREQTAGLTRGAQRLCHTLGAKPPKRFAQGKKCPGGFDHLGTEGSRVRGGARASPSFGAAQRHRLLPNVRTSLGRSRARRQKRPRSSLVERRAKRKMRLFLRSRIEIFREVAKDDLVERFVAGELIVEHRGGRRAARSAEERPRSRGGEAALLGLPWGGVLT